MARTRGVSGVGGVGGGIVIPDAVPVLSPGRHRRPRQGACFMEFASYLAGETWSDHPRCTHPLVAFLARGVNDFTSDDGRQRLAPLIPAVIGLTGDDPRLDAMVALRCASIALPVASESRQRALATGILACERMLVSLDGALSPEVAAIMAEAADAAPLAWEWAARFTRGLESKRPVTFTRQGRAIVSTSVLGVAQACTSDPDSLLASMLEQVIADTRGALGPADGATGGAAGTAHAAGTPAGAIPAARVLG